MKQIKLGKKGKGWHNKTLVDPTNPYLALKRGLD